MLFPLTLSFPHCYLYIQMTISNELLHNCLYFTANTLARNINRLAEEAFGPTGLSSSHALLLMLINEQPGISQKELAEAMHLAPSTMTRFVNVLMQRGLAVKESRGKLAIVHPTSQGQEMQPVIMESWKRLYHRYSAILGELEGVELTRVIDLANTDIEEKIS